MLPVVLLADDDDAFLYLVGYSFEKSALKASLQCVGDGEEIIEYLSRKGKFADETSFPLPSLVVVDLKMRWLTGFDVLQWRLQHPEFQKVPFIVLTSSDLEQDKERAEELGRFPILSSR